MDEGNLSLTRSSRLKKTNAGEFDHNLEFREEKGIPHSHQGDSQDTSHSRFCVLLKTPFKLLAMLGAELCSSHLFTGSTRCKYGSILLKFDRFFLESRSLEER